jgi:hypothetical protein
MQKITRIYVGNYGINMAWYDGVTFDLTDRDGEPTDTILNLENGGGKTTLLSFIFSCFETSQERFLKHIQNKNHRFSQYFSKDGLPGVVLIEWLMPSRVAGGAPYKLVMGQAVAVRTNAEREEVDRVFFSFETTQGLTFDTVPAPKLKDAAATATNMNEFSRWMHESHKDTPDFFHTRTQSEWQRHLRDERLIDVEMMQLQVNFSAQEGGIDTGFLTFTSEPEFVRKFFDLTLDAERSASVRLAVVNTCDKLRRKPHFQKCLSALSMLQTSLTQFNEAAQGFTVARASQEQATLQGAGLVLGLEALTRERSAAHTRETALAQEQDQLALEKDTTARNRWADAVSLTALRHRRRADATLARQTQTRERLTLAKAMLLHVQAAQARVEIAALDAQLLKLDEQSQAAQSELEPWRDNVEMQGALLRRALFVAETALRRDAAACATHETDSQQASSSLETELSALAKAEKALVHEQAKLSAALGAYQVALVGLKSTGVLDANEATSEAIDRLQSAALAHRAQAQSHLNESQLALAQETTLRAAAKLEFETSTRLQAQIPGYEKFLGEAHAERELLSQLPVLRQAADAETADPDSLGLMPALSRLILASEGEVAQCDVRLAELRADKSSILETGVAGTSQNVNKVIARLREMGLRSACAFNTYISQALPDAERARALVASNPARFSGVCVASSELDKARSIVSKSLMLTAPVMVSVQALEPEVSQAGQFVLSAGEDAAFNCVAAQKSLTEIDTWLAAKEELRQVFAQRQRDGLAAKQRLQAYTERYGQAAVRHAGEQVLLLTTEAAIAAQRAQETEELALTQRERAETLRGQATTASNLATKCDGQVLSVCQFRDVHEAGHAERQARAEEVTLELDAAGARRTVATAEVAQLRETEKQAYQQKLVHEGGAQVLGNERGALKYYDKEFHAERHLAENPQELAVLRVLYSDAESTYTTQAKERLGLVHERQMKARESRTAKGTQFTAQFPGIQTAQMGPYLTANFDTLIPATQAAISLADGDTREAEKAHAVTEHEHSSYVLEHPTINPPTPEMLAHSQEALNDALALALTERDQSGTQAQGARQAAISARDRARKAKDDERNLKATAGTLRAALSLPELLNADPQPVQEDATAQSNAVIVAFQVNAKAVDSSRSRAYKMFESLKTAATVGTLQEVEPDIASQLLRNDFEAACADSERLLASIEDRIGTTQSNLDGMTADFEACVGELSNLANTAITSLNSAVTNKRVPEGAPYVGGKSILKMRARFHELSQDVRRQHLRAYLDTLIDTSTIPAKGPEMVAEAVLRIHGKPLGIQMLKMVPDENLQYVAVDQIQNSGGEGVVMAMFLYMVINQLRSETQAKLKKAGGGPLILDNPFAKATTPTLWKAQRMLAQSMDVQLIFATALPDYNTVGEFGRFVRLRKAGKNTKTGRWHLEAVDLNLKPQEALAA